MALSSDPYEQKLYHMFQSHDVDAVGGLDRSALLKLCLTLELKERGHLLVKCLLTDSKTRVSFKEFREGLLHILGGDDERTPEGGHQRTPHAQACLAKPTEGISENSEEQLQQQQQQKQLSTGSPTNTVVATPVASSSAACSLTSNASSTTSGFSSSVSLSVSEIKQKFTATKARTDEVVTDDGAQNNVNGGRPRLSVESPPPLRHRTLVAANDDESSDREVLPKFIVGTKKYGRRSRPREDIGNGIESSSLSNSDNESVIASAAQVRSPYRCLPANPLPASVSSQPSEETSDGGSGGSAGCLKTSKVQRSASQSDIHGSKRRRPMGGNRLKRCASLPTHRQRPELALMNAKNVRDQLNMDEKIDKKIYFMNLSENLREIWDSLVGSGHGDLLNQSQLETVCERVGLQKTAARLAAKEVFAKLSLQAIEGISFDEFIVLLQSNSDILPMAPERDAEFDSDFSPKNSQDASIAIQAEENGFAHGVPDWTTEIGSLAASIIVDMWESAGIAAPAALLNELGFDRDVIQVTELVNALEEEQQRLGNSSDDAVLIVRASLALHKAEVNALRQAFIQLVEENKKLYADNKEVNHRALLLAQEVDERHNSLESATRNKIRHLEQRHHETVKELTCQLAYEREQLTHANALLEKRVQTLEVDEGKMKLEMGRLGDENEDLRQEQENLTREITDLLEKNIRLNRDIAELEENNRNDYDNEDGFVRKDSDEVLELIDRISSLQDENTNLRDKNDELSAEIETLNMELSKFKLKRSAINRTSFVDTNVGTTSVCGDQTPCSSAFDDPGVVAENSSAAVKRRGDSPSKTRLSDESPRLGKFRKCSNENDNESDSSGDWMALQSELGQSILVEEIVTSSGISSINDTSKDEEIKQLKNRIAELESIVEERRQVEQPSETASSQSAETEKLKSRCEELEQSLEQMRKEYEDCEDYWQAKVNDERQLYEEEQRISDDKFNELLKKMAEYEEQFSGQGSNMDKDGRLSPIDEKDCLEQQYLELEAEFEQSQILLEEKTLEVEKLQQKICELEQQNNYSSEALIPTTPRMETPEAEESPASSPINYLWNQSTIQHPVRDYQNPNWRQPLKSNSGPGAAPPDKCASPSPPPPVLEEEKLSEDEQLPFDRIISPIQKPSAVCIKEPLETHPEELRDLVDASDACSVKSIRSTHSVASTHSMSKSMSTCDVATVTEAHVNQLRLVQIKLQEEIKDLTHHRDCLIMEVQQLQEAQSILSKTYSKNSHPGLTQKIHNLEMKNRNLQSMVKQQQQYTESILHQIWQQQRSEINDLRNRLEAQSMVISDQATRLANNDILVKDLYMENTNLTSEIRRLKQQKARATMLQKLTQAAANSHQQAHAHPCTSLSGIVPGMP